MVKVKKKKGESNRGLIKRFIRRVTDEEILEDARESERHEPDSEKRKKQKYRLERKFEHKRSKIS